MDTVEIAEYLNSGREVGKVVGSSVVLDDVVLGSVEGASMKLYKQTRGGNVSRALMGYTVFQLIGIRVFEGLSEDEVLSLSEILNLGLDDNLRSAFSNAYAGFAVFGEEFEYSNNLRMTTFMTGLFKPNLDRPTDIQFA